MPRALEILGVDSSDRRVPRGGRVYQLPAGALRPASQSFWARHEDALEDLLYTINTAYRRRIWHCHPDRGGAEAEAALVNHAYAFCRRQLKARGVAD